MQPARAFHLRGFGPFELVERGACRFQMPFGQMQVNGRGFEVGVTEEQLHRGQIGSPFQQVSRETVGGVNAAVRLW